MNVLIVVETCFGNTARFAEAIAEGLGTQGAEVTVVRAADSRPEQLQGIDLLVVGSPTHNRGLPGPSSRRTAVAQGAAPAGTGVAEWLEQLSGYRGSSAAFDSVSGTSFWNGSAAKKIAKVLMKKSGNLFGTESFLVSATEGPAAEGELERAEKWGASLV